MTTFRLREYFVPTDGNFRCCGCEVDNVDLYSDPTYTRDMDNPNQLFCRNCWIDNWGFIKINYFDKSYGDRRRRHHVYPNLTREDTSKTHVADYCVNGIVHEDLDFSSDNLQLLSISSARERYPTIKKDCFISSSGGSSNITARCFWCQQYTNSDLTLWYTSLENNYIFSVAGHTYQCIDN
uniref:Uncharacterized protein n=1 Tax=viral metagenome TaxID=1070528 RepID=A0A6C0EI76_9ZZZZ